MDNDLAIIEHNRLYTVEELRMLSADSWNVSDIK
jgi:hypothetical protein